MTINSPDISSADISSPNRPIWDSALDNTLVCRAIFDETHDVKTFVFSPRRPARFVFEPGQFLTFTFDVAGTPVERCYTISSSAAIDATISITTKRMPRGQLSPWAHDGLRVGDSVRAHGPHGDFTPFGANGSEKYLLLSGGSGITPFASMVRTFADLAIDRDIVFVHAARTPLDIILRDDLARLARRLPRLRIVHVVEQIRGEPDWPGFVGRIDAPVLASVAPDLTERMVMACGPAPFMAAMRRLSIDAGLPDDRYAQESFDFATEAAAEIRAEIQDEIRAEIQAELTAAAPAGQPSPGITAAHQISFAKLARNFPCDADMTILEAAKRAGIPLPFSCAKGICGTCKTKKLAGSVDMKHGGGIRQREIDQGFILACCSRPLDDVVLDR